MRTEGDYLGEDKGVRPHRGKQMAQFEPAYQRTLGYEGGYANDPTDDGGETYKGIARNSHPNWPGWAIVDTRKKAANFPASLCLDVSLQNLVAEFYRTEFWNKIMGDSIPSQAIANELFDSAVNGGIEAAVGILQKALNLFVASGELLAVDGSMGRSTINVLNSIAITSNRTQAVLSAMVVLRGVRYIDIMRSKPSQRKFAVSWFSRLRC